MILADLAPFCTIWDIRPVHGITFGRISSSSRPKVHSVRSGTCPPLDPATSSIRTSQSLLAAGATVPYNDRRLLVEPEVEAISILITWGFT